MVGEKNLDTALHILYDFDTVCTSASIGTEYKRLHLSTLCCVICKIHID